ncbi:MAG: hypothetical protein Q8P13_00390 [bacterium]|nr:hypothetical protein [bacterium]
MKKSLVKQFEEQFGKEWVCTCSAPFDPKSLEIISENKNSLIAHYVCPNCQREQMLAAAVRHNGVERKQEAKNPRINLPHSTITADDVLDIKEELKKLKTSAIRGLDRSLRFSRQAQTDLGVSLGSDSVN